MPLITLEGIDGSGKSTQIELLRRALPIDRTLFTKNPGATSLGQVLRQILLDRDDIVLCPEAELLLYMSDRAQHYQEIIAPALAEGKLLICDRYTDSSLAYQGYARGLPTELICQLNSFSTQHVRVDCTFLLRISPAVSAQRLQSKKADKIEVQGLAFLQKVADAFDLLAEREPERFCVLEADRLSPEELHWQIMQHLRHHRFCL